MCATRARALARVTLHHRNFANRAERTYLVYEAEDRAQFEIIDR